MFCRMLGVSGLAADPPLLRALPFARGGTRLGGQTRWIRHDTKTGVNKLTIDIAAQIRELDRLRGGSLACSRGAPLRTPVKSRRGRVAAWQTWKPPRVEVHLWYELKRERGNTRHHTYCTWHECGQSVVAGMEFVS